VYVCELGLVCMCVCMYNVHVSNFFWGGRGAGYGVYGMFFMCM
jgi:hypothetical protein